MDENKLCKSVIVIIMIFFVLTLLGKWQDKVTEQRIINNMTINNNLL